MDDSIVEIHSHLATHAGQEHGLVCWQCKDAIMGLHPEKVSQANTHVINFE